MYIVCEASDGRRRLTDLIKEILASYVLRDILVL